MPQVNHEIITTVVITHFLISLFSTCNHSNTLTDSTYELFILTSQFVITVILNYSGKFNYTKWGMVTDNILLSKGYSLNPLTSYAFPNSGSDLVLAFMVFLFPLI